MDKVLIVDGDPDFLGRTKEGLERVRQFEVLTAADGEEAISIMSSRPIAVLATDIETPGLDALELLAYMSQNHPVTPCIVMTDRGKPWFKKRISQQSFLYHLEKPFEIGSLVSALFVGLNLRDEGANAQGMTMASLLPLLELQQKTCRMQVRAADRRLGFLYFEEGEIIDAHCGKLSVQEAAREIASWNRISFSLSELPRRRTRRRVKTKLMDFADAVWSTEAGSDSPDPAAGTPEKPIPLEEAVIELVDALGEEDRPAGEEKAAYPDPAVSPEARQKAARCLERIAAEVKDLRECRLAAVIDEKGRVLAARGSRGGPDVHELAAAAAGIMDNADLAALGLNLDAAEAFTLHAPGGILIMQRLGNFSNSGLYALVSCGPGGNWYFIKSCLEDLPFSSL